MCIVKYLFSSMDNQFENLQEVAVLAREMLTSGFPPWHLVVKLDSDAGIRMRYGETRGLK